MNLSEVLALRGDTSAFVRAATNYYLRTDKVTGIIVPIDVQFAPNPIVNPNTLRPLVLALRSILSGIIFEKTGAFAMPAIKTAMAEASKRINSFLNVVDYEISIGNGEKISANLIDNAINPMFFGWFVGIKDRMPPAIADGLSISRAANSSVLGPIESVFETIVLSTVGATKEAAESVQASANSAVDALAVVGAKIQENLPSLSSALSMGALLAVAAGVATVVYINRK